MTTAAALFATDDFAVLEDYLSRQLFAMRLEPWGPSDRYAVWARHFSADGVDIVEERLRGGKTIYALDPLDGLAITLPQHGVGEINTRQDNRIDGSQPSAIDLRTLDFSHFGDRRSHHCVVLRQSKLTARLASHLDGPVRQPAGFSLHLKASAPVVTGLQALIAAVFDSPLGAMARRDTPLRESIGNTFADMLLEQWPNTYSEQLHRRLHKVTPRHIRQAVDLIASDEPGLRTVEQLAQRLEVSPRTLQYGFERYLDMPVQRYWRNHRLNRARDDLLGRPDVPVRLIALDWGFSNEGRFTAYFREAFGQSPTELRLARRT